MPGLGLFFESRFAHLSDHIIQYLSFSDTLALSQALSPNWPRSIISDQRPVYVWHFATFWLKQFVYPQIEPEIKDLWQIIVDSLSFELLNNLLLPVIIEELKCAASSPIWIKDHEKKATVYASFLDCPIQTLIRHVQPFGGQILLELCQKCEVYEMLQIYSQYRLESPIHSLGVPYGKHDLSIAKMSSNNIVLAKMT